MKKTLLILCLILFLIVFLYLQNNFIVTKNITFTSKKVPKSFDNFVIVHLSDLHGKVFGKENKPLILKVQNAKPDIIVITGDLIDVSFFDKKSIDELMKNLVRIAPLYYVTGNQELNSNYLISLKELLEKDEVHILSNSAETIVKNNQSILLVGVEDPIYADVGANSLNRGILSKELKEALKNNNTEENLTILLSHRPEQFQLYSNFKIDLTFAGHAHGGQIRLPFIGGLFAPNQGFFPKYTDGKYTLGSSSMIVSRGLGNSSIPQRLFDQPEIVVTTLKHK